MLHAILSLLQRSEGQLTSAPFSDRSGRKGAISIFAHARRHQVRRVTIAIPGWPVLPRPLRVLFLSDLHLGSHTNDIVRLEHILGDAARYGADVGCLGGDFINTMRFGKGHIPPDVTASVISRLHPRFGWFSVLGDHDEAYGTERVGTALRRAGIQVLLDERAMFSFLGQAIDVVGLAPSSPDPARILDKNLIGGPAIVLAHDPAAFARLPKGPYLMLSGHTHGGQMQLPWIGPVINMSAAPLRWTHGHVVEDGRHLYVTSGIGTSGVPLRIGVSPEVAIIDINGGAVA